ncbi:hypothetical protein OC844_006826 [Tilletia horrida]|nr:hypothetical protein OC844_006826 [Tilletia horrida]
MSSHAALHNPDAGAVQHPNYSDTAGTTSSNPSRVPSRNPDTDADPDHSRSPNLGVSSLRPSRADSRKPDADADDGLSDDDAGATSSGSSRGDAQIPDADRVEGLESSDDNTLGDDVGIISKAPSRAETQKPDAHADDDLSDDDGPPDGDDVGTTSKAPSRADSRNPDADADDDLSDDDGPPDGDNIGATSKAPSRADSRNPDADADDDLSDADGPPDGDNIGATSKAPSRADSQNSEADPDDDLSEADGPPDGENVGATSLGPSRHDAQISAYDAETRPIDMRGTPSDVDDDTSDDDEVGASSSRQSGGRHSLPRRFRAASSSSSHSTQPFRKRARSTRTVIDSDEESESSSGAPQNLGKARLSAPGLSQLEQPGIHLEFPGNTTDFSVPGHSDKSKRARPLPPLSTSSSSAGASRPGPSPSQPQTLGARSSAISDPAPPLVGHRTPAPPVSSTPSRRAQDTFWRSSSVKSSKGKGRASAASAATPSSHLVESRDSGSAHSSPSPRMSPNPIARPLITTPIAPHPPGSPNKVSDPIHPGPSRPKPTRVAKVVAASAITAAAQSSSAPDPTPSSQPASPHGAVERPQSGSPTLAATKTKATVPQPEPGLCKEWLQALQVVLDICAIAPTNVAEIVDRAFQLLLPLEVPSEYRNSGRQDTSADQDPWIRSARTLDRSQELAITRTLQTMIDCCSFMFEYRQLCIQASQSEANAVRAQALFNQYRADGISFFRDTRDRTISDKRYGKALTFEQVSLIGKRLQGLAAIMGSTAFIVFILFSTLLSTPSRVFDASARTLALLSHLLRGGRPNLTKATPEQRRIAEAGIFAAHAVLPRVLGRFSAAAALAYDAAGVPELTTTLYITRNVSALPYKTDRPQPPIARLDEAGVTRAPIVMGLMSGYDVGAASSQRSGRRAVTTLPPWFLLRSFGNFSSEAPSNRDQKTLADIFALMPDLKHAETDPLFAAQPRTSNVEFCADFMSILPLLPSYCDLFSLDIDNPGVDAILQSIQRGVVLVGPPPPVPTALSILQVQTAMREANAPGSPAQAHISDAAENWGRPLLIKASADDMEDEEMEDLPDAQGVIA